MRAFLTRHTKMIDAPHLPQSAFRGSPLEKNNLAIFTIYCPDERIYFDALTAIDHTSDDNAIVHIVAIASNPRYANDSDSPLSIDTLEDMAHHNGFEITLDPQIVSHIAAYMSLHPRTEQFTIQ